MPFIVQFLDHEEGSAARWHDIKGSRHETREDARTFLRRCREDDDEWCLYSYRVVEEGSPLYYSQPTDKLEY